MKNVVLIAQDRLDITETQRRNLVEALLNGGYRIVLMVVNANTPKDDYLSYDGVKQVITSMELEYNESMKGISWDVIMEHKDLQNDIESCAFRMYADYNMSKYYYYSMLSFWNQFFLENQVDIVLHSKAYHGWAYDVCDIIAQKYKVPCVHINYMGYNNTFSFYVYRKVIPVPKPLNESLNYLLQSDFDKTLLPPSIEKKSCFEKILYNLGGNLMEDFVNRLLRWDWKPRSYQRKREDIYWSDKFLGYLKLMRTKRCMQSLSNEPKQGEKYVCYFLHLEPEAPMHTGAILESQLVMIKMLSETLPDGWFVYVKEHPAQFDVNNDPGYYHMYDMPLFKTQKFYKKIASMPHVKLINFRVSSKELVQHSQAVASICGTVFFETVLEKKPILVFSDLNPVAYLKDAFAIRSFDDCKKAMKKLENGFRPNYEDADEVIGKYVFKGEYLVENIMALAHDLCSGERT